ncbi:hypothetical protein [Candidatus Poriferisodalis sp.]|uniref:hypothetical protein n=1 Tax=Candidatus Poriferisodalis sp. TaxID=3101277 RepID=UPI003B01942B
MSATSKSATRLKRHSNGDADLRQRGVDVGRQRAAAVPARPRLLAHPPSRVKQHRRAVRAEPGEHPIQR